MKKDPAEQARLKTEKEFIQFLLQWTTHQQFQAILDSSDKDTRGRELSDKINDLARTVSSS